MSKTSKKTSKKPLREPVMTEVSETIELRLKIGDDVYVAELQMWKEVGNG